MKHEDLLAIDIHTHAEVSCWNPFDNYGEEYDRAADKFFGSNRRPTIEETVAYYRERKIGLVMFTVDAESHMGRRRIPNEEIAKAARDNSDMMIAFASIDPHKGKMGAREARRTSAWTRASSSRGRYGLRMKSAAPSPSDRTEASSGGCAESMSTGKSRQRSSLLIRSSN